MASRAARGAENSPGFRASKRIKGISRDSFSTLQRQDVANRLGIWLFLQISLCHGSYATFEKGICCWCRCHRLPVKRSGRTHGSLYGTTAPMRNPGGFSSGTPCSTFAGPSSHFVAPVGFLSNSKMVHLHGFVLRMQPRAHANQALVLNEHQKIVPNPCP